MRLASKPLPLLLAGLLAAPAAQAAAADAAAQAKTYFQAPAIQSALLSPDGGTLAVTMRNASGRQQLVTMNPDQPASARAIAGFSDADITGVQWLGNDKLLFQLYDSQSGSGEQKGSGLYLVRKDGSQQKQLIARQRQFVTGATAIASRTLSPWHFLLQRLPGNEQEVMIGEYKADNVGDLREVGLYRLNVDTQRKVGQDYQAPDHISGWLVNKEGVPLVAEAHRDGRYKTWVREDGAGKWAQWQDVDQLSTKLWEPLFRSKGLLYVSARDDKGYAGIYRLDPATHQPEAKPILSTPGFDSEAHLIRDDKRGEVLGWRINTDAPGTHWLNTDMAAAQQKIDKQLPGGVNLIYCQDCLDAKRWTVRSFSDQNPGSFWLYDRAGDKLTPVAQQKPEIRPEKMATTDFYRFNARDGLSIPVYVTRPQGDNGPRPAVLMVHGGPYVRGGHWGWEPMRQYLAAQGYVVIEPDYRGSTGYGFQHFQAGWKQWGLKMQDDMEDAVRWAADKKLIDPKRVCIAGASYGGYAALMGPIRYPDSYRCAISWVGVTDLELLGESTLSDMDDQYRNFGHKKLVIDLPADRKQMEETSPTRQAARFKAPLLIAYGSEDRRVPIEHGTRWKKAAEKAGVDMEWVVYDGEGHGWMREENRVDFALRVKNFLAKHLGN